LRRRQQHVICGGADLHARYHVAGFELHGDFAGAVDAFEIIQRIAPHPAGTGGKHQVQVRRIPVILGQRHDCCDALILRQWQDIDQGLAPRLWIAHWQAPHLHPVNHAQG